MAVIQRDRQRCVHCASASSLEFDYLISPAKGGAAVLGNLQLLCTGCMRLKYQGR
ncbi:HNH endonuclease [Deinococcus irradiatisoli]